MAGSYGHATTEDGKLRSNETFVGMVENLGDAYETVEEMYGMIWFLAQRLSELQLSGLESPEDYVRRARQRYREGLVLYSPGVES